MTSQSKKPADSTTFESTIESLESLVEKLENQETSLEDSLAAFETGIGLTRKAQAALSEAEQKVRLLLESNGEPVAEDFKTGEENE